MKQACRILAALGLVFIVFASKAADRQWLNQSTPPAATTAPVIGRLAGDKTLDLAISLPLRHQAALSNLLERITDPASPEFRHYLTPAQFTAQFGPTEADYQAVASFARSNGLTVTHTYANRTLLDVRGSVAVINKVFHVTLMEYQHPTEARTFFAPDTAPSLDLATPVLHVGGLDNFTLPRPLMKFKPLDANAPKPQSQNGSGPSGLYMGRDFRNAYAPGVSLDGSGQRVGLLEFDGYFPQDITAYETTAGLPNVPLTNVLIGASGIPGANTVEVSLDIEMAISMASNLEQVVIYEGNLADDVLDQMSLDNTCRQLSSSWTYSIDDFTLQLFQEFAAQGQSLFQSSGDADAYTGAPATPSDAPYLTSVGGTTLSMTPNGGSYSSETVWNWGSGTGSSGGISATYPIPTWQQGIDMSTNQGSTVFRNIPDVAMIADQVFVIGENGRLLDIGGTSCAAPLWAAFTALANQLAASNGLPAVGFINPALYAIGKGSSYGVDFHDITTGNNESPSSPSRFTAVPGYDLCTGWGSPVGSSLIYAVGLIEPLQVLPVAPGPFAGPVGGPFAPSLLTFTLMNSGLAPLNWEAASTSSAFDVAPAGGQILGNSNVSVIVTVDPSANALAVGSYKARIWFTNLNDHFVQNRIVTLLVAAPPSIISQPTNQNLLEGQTAVFNVVTAANSQMAYQWFKKNGSNTIALSDSSSIAGSGSSTLTLFDVTDADAASYFVMASNAAGTITSSNARLTLVASAPVIAVAPTNLALLPGDTAVFAVTAYGNQPMSYQWQFNGTNLFNTSGIGGATTAVLTVSNVSTAWSGVFTVALSNALGTNSASASLGVVRVTAPGVSLRALSSFSGGSLGQNPYGGLVTNRNLPTSFAGTTYSGGADGLGMVFRMSTNGAVTQTIPFDLTEGANPYDGLTLGRDGSLYGVAGGGGSAGDGTIFRIAANGYPTILASLTGIDGNLPVASLFQAADGAFYGTSVYGGQFGLGNLFRITTGGAFTNLLSFDGVLGAGPTGSLVQDVASNLYGTTENGGYYSYGAIFVVTPSGQIRDLISFNGNDGEQPVAGLTMDAAGNFYGSTITGGAYGEGEIFEVMPDGTGSVLYDFTGGADGANPYGALTLGADGNLYGTTEYGGPYDQGTIFEISPDGALVTLASFDGFQGAQPTGALLECQGAWYGTTVNGGVYGLGATFQLSVTGPLQITSQPADDLVDLGGSGLFQVAAFGAGPVTYQWLKDGTNLSNASGVSGSFARVLTIADAMPSSAGVYSVVISNFFGAVTSSPALLQVLISTPVITQQPLDVSVLDGATAQFTVQAMGDYPLTYQWYRNGQALADNQRLSGSTNSVLTLRQATDADSGSYSVRVYDDLFYAQSSNALLLVTPTVAQYYTVETLHSFAGADGSNPYASLVQAGNGLLYGTAVYGGSASSGGIFSVCANGVFDDIYSFSGGSDGANPFGGLVQGPGTNSNLYGVAAEGGAYNGGTLFQLGSNQAATGLYSFTGGSDGLAPVGSLIIGADGNLYGTTYEGGYYDEGSIFVATTAGTVQSLYSFTGEDDGELPEASLTLAADGSFYGCASEGGTNLYGTVFNFQTNGNLTILHSFSGDDGAFPFGNLTLGADGRYYGTAYEAGPQGYGTVFAIATNGAFTNLFSFNYGNGALVNAGLVPSGDGAFFGAVQNGGPGGAGGIFKITTNGVWTPVLWFNGANGAYPESAPIPASDGYYYGVTYYGGASNQGSVYRLGVPSAPLITAQPADVFAPLNDAATFTVAANSSTAISYQWFYNGAAITNATNDVLTLTNLTSGNGGSYYVALTNAVGWTNSRTAVLTIVGPPALQSAVISQPAGQPPQIVFSWSAGPGLQYQPQFRTAFDDAGWTNLGPPIVAGTLLVEITDYLTNVQRYYRMILLP